MTAPQKVKIFYCYHHEDENLKERLKRQINDGNIISQDYSDILPGQVIQEEIDELLKSVDILLLLVSADFTNSYDEFMSEIQVALTRHTRKDISIIAIILRACRWRNCLFAGKRLEDWKVLPVNGKPVGESDNLDRVLTDIADEVHKVAEPIKKENKRKYHQEQAEI